jgi:hypothetical protein
MNRVTQSRTLWSALFSIPVRLAGMPRWPVRETPAAVLRAPGAGRSPGPEPASRHEPGACQDYRHPP